MSERLPVEEILESILSTLGSSDTLLLEAPPGAGKTTLVPLALLDAPWLAGRRIVMLQPRRIAARNAARRMAELLGEAVGETVGYRIRLESRVGPRTRIEVVTEGVLLRLLEEDPALESVGLLIFDEFHERSVDADLGLALALHGRATFAPENPAKILVMSATLGDAALEDYLQAPRIRSEGRQYPVCVVYGRAAAPRERLEDRVLDALERACREQPDSSVLVFLPGQGEIHRVADRFVPAADTTVHALYGNLSPAEQQAAIAPCAAGRRKVVLATNVAETSLTIDGVDVVVDAGLERRSRLDPATGMSRLHTERISLASATQRAGRAGRLRPGVCYRLWSEAQEAQLSPQRSPAIETADLAPVVLQLFAWGIYQPDELHWLSPPPAAAFAQARDLLVALGAIEGADGDWRLTAHGRAMASLPLHPRLAHLLLSGEALGLGKMAGLTAAALSEGLPAREGGSDFGLWLEWLEGATRPPASVQGWIGRTRDLAQQLWRQLPHTEVVALARPCREQAPAFLLAAAYPDRIARRRHSGGYQLSNGRSARFADACALEREKWLVVAALSGTAGRSSDTIRCAAALDPALFEAQLAPLVREERRLGWETDTGLFRAEDERRVGALLLTRDAMPEVSMDERQSGLVALLRADNLERLPWTPAAEAFRARAALMHSLLPDWPAFDRETLCATADDWLALFLAPVRRLSDLKRVDLVAALKSRLDYAQQEQLETWLPERCTVPSGSRMHIDYTQSPPVLAVKLQEMFGARETPALAGGRIALQVHLLSPAGRPLQVTQDLGSFWRNVYPEVRREMKGRYPKHPWPEDPLTAAPTAHTKKRQGMDGGP